MWDKSYKYAKQKNGKLLIKGKNPNMNQVYKLAYDDFKLDFINMFNDPKETMVIREWTWEISVKKENLFKEIFRFERSTVSDRRKNHQIGLTTGWYRIKSVMRRQVNKNDPIWRWEGKQRLGKISYLQWPLG